MSGAEVNLGILNDSYRESGPSDIIDQGRRVPEAEVNPDNLNVG